MSKSAEQLSGSVRDTMLIIDSLPVPSLLLQENRIVACNQRFAALVGRNDSASITGKSIRGLLTRESLKTLQSACTLGAPISTSPIELTFLDPEGKEIPAKAWGSQPQNGAPAHYLFQVLDFREEHRVLDEVKRSEHRLAHLFSQSVLPAVIIKDDQVVAANPAFSSLIGLESPEKVVGTAYESFIAEDGKSAALAAIKKLLKKKGHADPIRYSLQKTDGGTIPVEVRVSRLEGSSDEEIILQHQDATTLLAIEENLDRNEHETQLLAKFVSETTSSLTLEEVCESALKTLADVLSMEGGAVYLLDRQRKDYGLVLQKNLSDEVLEKIGRPPTDEGIGGFLSKTLEARLFKIEQYPSYLPHRALFKQEGYRAIGFVPMVFSGVSSGFILLVSKKEVHRVPSQAFFTTLSNDLGKVLDAARVVRAMSTSENEIRTLIESVGEVLYRAAPDGSFLYLSPAIEALTGYEPSEFFRNKTLLLSLTHRDDKKYLLERSANLESIGDSAILEYRILPKGKAAYRWIRDMMSVLRDEQGTIFALTGALSDITNYKNLADELVQTNELNNSIVSSVQEGVVVYNDALRCIQWNQAMERITGLRKEDVLGKPATDLFREDDPGLAPLLMRALKGENVSSGEVRYTITGSEKEVFLWGGYGPLRDAHNEILGVVGILTDLSERKSLERELKDSEQVLRNVIDTMGDILMITDLKGNVLEVNRAFLNVLGYNRHDIVGYEFPYPWLIEEEMGRYVLWIGTLREKNWLHDFDMTWRSKDGRLVPMSLSTTLLRNSLGEPIAMVNIARDITERKRLTHDLETRKNQVEMLNRIISAGNQTMDFGAIFRTISAEIATLVPFDDIAVVLLEQESRFRVFATAREDSQLKDREIPTAGTFSYLAVQQGKPIIVDDTLKPEFDGTFTRDAGFRSQICLPIVVEQRAIGAINILSSKPGVYNDQHQGMLQAIASQTGSIIDRILLFKKVSEDASYIHNLLDSIDSVVYTVDTQYRILEVNKAWYEFIHETGSKVLDNYHGVSIFDALTEESMRLLFQNVGGDVLSGVIRFFSQEFIHPTPSGNRIYQVTMNPMVIDRKITGLVISHSDITALKDSELALKKNNEQLVALNEISTLFSTPRSIEEILATALPLLVTTLEADAAVVFLVHHATGSLELAQHYGFDGPAETILETMSAQGSATGMVVGTNEPVFIPGDLANSKELLPASKAALFQERIESLAILPLRSKDKVLGAFNLLYRSPHPFTDQQRELLSLLGNQLGTALDNAQLYDELRSQIERLTVLYEFSEQLTSKLDPSEIYDVVVDHVTRVIPFSEFTIDLVRPGHSAGIAAFRACQENGICQTLPIDTTVRRFLPGSAELRVIEANRSYHNDTYTVLHVPMSSKESMLGIMSIVGEEGRRYSETHLRLLESIGNLTAIALEKGKLYEETIQKSLEIETRNRELDDFTYVVSHDLKEPLISIEGFSKILLIDYAEQLAGEGKEYLDAITGASVRMKALIDDLLMLSRVSRPSESFREFPVAKVIDEIRTDMEFTIRQRNVKLIVPPDLPVITGNETHIKIVFRNLISNALKFNRSEQPTIEIGFQNRENISYLFSVTDNGIGIEPEFFEKIFVIFQRLHRREDYEGTGAGLAIVKKIIEMHKGRIWVESQPGKGTTFFFTIPHIPH